MGGDCALGVQKGSCGGAACHVLAMACVGGGSAIGEDYGGLPSGHSSVISVLVGGEGGGCDGGPLEESEEGCLGGKGW